MFHDPPEIDAKRFWISLPMFPSTPQVLLNVWVRLIYLQIDVVKSAIFFTDV